MDLTIQELGSLGEFVGAVAVVISLVYLALQVRQNSRYVRENTEFLRASNEISSNEGNVALRTWYVDHPGLFDVQRRGDAGERLEGEDAVLYALLLQSVFESHMTYFVQHERGLTGDEIWNYWVRYFDRECRQPGVRAWWRRSRDRFPEDFRAYIDEKVDRAERGAG
jgi:hypothetical protein